MKKDTDSVLNQINMASGAGGSGDIEILKPDALARLLKSASDPGTSLLCTTKGDLISSGGATGSEEMAASVVANVWSTYEKGGEKMQAGKLQTIFVECEEMRVASVLVFPGLLLCMMAAKSVALGALQAKLLALKDHLELNLGQVFAQGA